VAYLLEVLVFWTDQSRTLAFGIVGVLGIAAVKYQVWRLERST
jgi:hypothetical protein